MQTISLPRAARLLCVLAFLFSTLSLSGRAQTAGAGTISGTVTDGSNSVVAGASITVLDTDTGVAHTFATNSEGIYVAPFLQPGHYTVEANAAGFGKVRVELPGLHTRPVLPKRRQQLCSPGRPRLRRREAILTRALYPMC
jgi:hypothetical protein